MIVQLDPPGAISGRTMLDLTAAPFGLGDMQGGGIDWGDAQIQAFMSQQKWGSSSVDFVVPNRMVKVPLFLGTGDYASLAEQVAAEEAARAKLQQKVARLQAEGGVLLRQRTGGPAMYADIVNATLTLPDEWGEAAGIEANVVLTLECLPDFWGDEIALDSIAATGWCASVLEQAGTQAVIEGDYPARCRIVLTDTSGHDQHGVIWAFRSRHYDSAATASLIYEAEALDYGFGIGTLQSFDVNGSYNPWHEEASGGSVAAAQVAGSWTPILQTDYQFSPLTHQGSYRVRARVFVEGGADSDVRLRLAWQVGSVISPEINDPATVAFPNQFAVVDLGTVRLDAPPVGNAQWEGQVQGQTVSGDAQTVAIDQLYLQPLDETAGIAAYNPSAYASDGLYATAIADAFVTQAAALSGLATSDGNAEWAGSGAGSATDFSVASGADGNAATRSTTSESAEYQGRLDYLAPTGGVGAFDFTDVQVSARLYVTAIPAGLDVGLIARYNSSSDWLGAFVYQSSAGHYAVKIVRSVIGVGATVLTGGSAVSGTSLSGAAMTFQVTAEGEATVWLDGTVMATATDTEYLASGGSLQKGSAGIYDGNTSATASTRQIEGFSVSAVPADAAVYANSVTEIRTDGVVRQDPNAAYGPVSIVQGDLPRLPASGVEGRAVELFLRPTRDSLTDARGSFGDAALDTFTVQVKYRPCWLSRP